MGQVHERKIYFAKRETMIESMSYQAVFLVSLVVISVARLGFAGVYRESIALRIPKSFLSRVLSPKFLSDDKKRKLHENVYYTIWHTFSFLAVLYTVGDAPWFEQMVASRETGWSIYGWPHSVSTRETYLYMVELAFWVSCLLFMAVETVRKDFTEMLIHHISTIALISLSFLYGFMRIGFVVLLVHDIGDIFLYSAKSFNYMKREPTTTILFGVFVVVFFISRLVIFAFVVKSAWLGCLNYYSDMNGTAEYGARILPALLTILQLLHYMWFVLIVRMIFRMLFKKRNAQKDIRSDDDSDADMTPVKKNGKKSK